MQIWRLNGWTVLVVALGCGIDSRTPQALDTPTLSDSMPNGGSGGTASTSSMTPECSGADCPAPLPLDGPGGNTPDTAPETCESEGTCPLELGAACELDAECASGACLVGRCCARVCEICSECSEEGYCTLTPGVCRCTPGVTATCAELTSALGVCADRVVSCSDNGNWLAEGCQGGAEVCDPDFLDEDCDGELNESPCETFTAIEGTDSHACAISTSGAVYCWGSNISGELGDGTSSYRIRPTRVVGLPGAAISLALGTQRSCAVLADQSVYCWGGFLNLVQGGGEFTFSETPVLANLFPQTLGLVLLFDRACAILPDRGVSCSVVDSDTEAITRVEALQGMTDVQSLTTNISGLCALLGDGTARCWNGQAPAISEPVVGLTGASQLDGDYATACAIVSGVVRCWGSNTELALGEYAAPAPNVIVTLPLSSNAVALDSAAFQGCAILDNGLVSCWGTGIGREAIASLNQVAAIRMTSIGDRLFVRKQSGEVVSIATRAGAGPTIGNPDPDPGARAHRVFGP